MNLVTTGVYTDPQRPTSTKTRVIARGALTFPDPGTGFGASSAPHRQGIQTAHRSPDTGTTCWTLWLLSCQRAMHYLRGLR